MKMLYTIIILNIHPPHFQITLLHSVIIISGESIFASFMFVAYVNQYVMHSDIILSPMFKLRCTLLGDSIGCAVFTEICLHSNFYFQYCVLLKQSKNSAFPFHCFCLYIYI